ncbi:MAG: MATE family efflux transporter [[Clostridium] innocuum]
MRRFIPSMLASGGVAVLCRDMGSGSAGKGAQNAALAHVVLCDPGAWLLCACYCGGLLFTDELLQLLHAKGRILPYARGYLSMLLLFTPFCMLQVLYQSMFVAAGRPLLPGMVSTAMCAGGVNVDFWIWPSCPAFIWELGGALATGRLYGSGCIWNAFFLQRKERSCILHGQLGMLPC